MTRVLLLYILKNRYTVFSHFHLMLQEISESELFYLMQTLPMLYKIISLCGKLCRNKEEIHVDDRPYICIRGYQVSTTEAEKRTASWVIFTADVRKPQGKYNDLSFKLSACIVPVWQQDKLLLSLGHLPVFCRQQHISGFVTVIHLKVSLRLIVSWSQFSFLSLETRSVIFVWKVRIIFHIINLGF